MRYAKISEALEVSGYVVLDAHPDVPKHKVRADGGLFLRPIVEDAAPNFRPELERVETTVCVERERVSIKRSVVRHSIEDQIAAVKNEAQRRIYDKYPPWKQANMTARAVELVRLGEVNWGEQEVAEAATLDAVWAEIKAIRRASGEIEKLDPIPFDFDADHRWAVS